MSFYALQQVNQTTYDRIARDYFAFIAVTNNPDKEPVSVFSPLSEKMIDELELIREVSRELQEKKRQEIERQKADAEKIVEEKTEGDSEQEENSKTEEENKAEDNENTNDVQEKKEE